MISVWSPLIIFLFKMLLYLAAFKLRKIGTVWMKSALCGGSSLLVGMIPFPDMLHFALVIAVAAYFITKNGDVDIYPEGLGIPMAVEITAAFALQFAVMPLLELL